MPMNLPLLHFALWEIEMAPDQWDQTRPADTARRAGDHARDFFGDILDGPDDLVTDLPPRDQPPLPWYGDDDDEY
jgi:hypothetical protein